MAVAREGPSLEESVYRLRLLAASLPCPSCRLVAGLEQELDWSTEIGRAHV